MESEAESEIRQLVFAGVAGGGDFAFDAAVAEAAGDEDSVETLEFGGDVFVCEGFGVDAADVDLAVVGNAAVRDGFVDGFVGVLQFDVFSDDADGDFAGGVFYAADDLLPDVLLRAGFFDAEEFDHEIVNAFFLEFEGEFVDGVDVGAADDGFDGDVAEEGDFFAEADVERMTVAAADEDVGLDADFAELGDGLLSGFCLQLAGGLHEGDEGDVDENAVAGADFEGELAEGFDEGESFDVAGGSADFGDEDIDVFSALVDAFLDFVCDVGNDLDGVAEVDAFALFLDDVFVNLAGAHAVDAREFSAGETFVVAEVEVGFGAVFEDVDFAVLEGAHGAWVHVDVGIQFEHGDFQTATFKDRGQGCCGNTFAKGRDNPASNEYIFGHSARRRSVRRSVGRTIGQIVRCLKAEL